MRRGVRKAFTLVEILIVVVILGILAAIVVPQFTNASQDAQVGNVESQLQTIRQQIELFRVRNNGEYPNFPLGANDGWGNDDWVQDPSIAFAARGMVGRNFLRSAPVNPWTRSASIGAAEGPNVGWVWEEDAANPGVFTIRAAYFNEDHRDPSSANFGIPWRRIQ